MLYRIIVNIINPIMKQIINDLKKDFVLNLGTISSFSIFISLIILLIFFVSVFIFIE